MTTAPDAGAFAALGALLRQDRPADLAGLVGAHPDLAPALAAAKMLGTPVAGGISADRLQEGLMQMARLGLAAAAARVALIGQSLPRRARRARRLKLFGGLVAAVSSAGVISALALAQPVAALASAALGLTTSVTALVGEHLDSPLVGPRKSLAELLAEMLAIEKDIRDAEIALIEAGPAPEAAVAAGLARTANGIAARLRVLELVEGVAPARPDAPDPGQALSSGTARP